MSILWNGLKKVLQRDKHDRVSQTEIIEFWHHGSWRYSIYILWNGSQFVFEGKQRNTLPRGYSDEGYRHIYFPYDNRPTLEIGNKKQAVEFLTNILLIYNCPSNVLSKVIAKVRGWSD